MTQEQKKAALRARNRLSKQRSRDRQKVTMVALQAKVAEQEARIKKLEERLSRYEPV
eukprot:XP_001694162.1 predicted protein [Chlamydomonas reinhardtii]